jgi:hypothetical protein
MAVPVALLCATAPELQGPVVAPTKVTAAAGASTTLSSSSSFEGVHLPLQGQRQGSHAATTSCDATTAAAFPQEQGQQPQQQQQQPKEELLPLNRDLLVLSLGLGALLFVPLFKQFTNLPPYMGMLSGLGVLWMVTDALHFGENRAFPRVQDALRNLDIAGQCYAWLGLVFPCLQGHAWWAGVVPLLCCFCYCLRSLRLATYTVKCC